MGGGGLNSMGMGAGSLNTTGMGNMISAAQVGMGQTSQLQMGMGMGGQQDKMGMSSSSLMAQGGMGQQSQMPMAIALSAPQMNQMLLPSVSKSNDSMESLLGIFPCVRLRGIPFECTVEDIAMFFQGLNILDIVLLEQQGRAAGKALVLFSSAFDLPAALARDRQHIGRRYIEVFQGSRMDFYDAVYEMRKRGDSTSDFRSSGSRKRSNRDDDDDEDGNEKRSAVVASKGQGVIRMRGLPFSANRADVLDFFRGYNVVADSVMFPTNSSGRVTGEAYVAFDSASDARDAMEKNREMMGSRYVELFMSSPEEMARYADS